MNRTQTEIKLLALHEIGIKIENLLESSKTELLQVQGAKQALADALKRVEDGMKSVNKDFKDGRIGLAEAELANKYIQQSMKVVETLLKDKEAAALQAQGRVMANTRLVKEIKDSFEQEKRRLEAFTAQEARLAAAEKAAAAVMRAERLRQEEENPDSTARRIGEHPGDPLADRRAESRSVPPVAQSEIPSTAAASEDVPTPEAETVEAPAAEEQTPEAVPEEDPQVEVTNL